VPRISHPPANPFVYDTVLGAGNDPQATVISPGAVIVGKAAGSTVIVLDTLASGLPHRSIAVHVSVTVPPHAGGVGLNVEGSDVPLIKQGTANPLVYPIELDDGNDPQATVISPRAVIVGKGAGSTVIVLDTLASGRPHGSVAVHVSVTVPPHVGEAPLIVEGSEFPLIRQDPDWPFV
jgi:hypothetical protein